VRLRWLVVGACGLATVAAPAQARADDPMAPAHQAQNLALSTTRALDITPDMAADIATLTARAAADRTAMLAADPERRPDPSFCTGGILCVGDPRLYDWAATGGIVEPVLFTARDGATLSGHLWATRSGPAKRPGVLIVNGSIIGIEEVYWWAAQTLAKAGYVVMTFDVQGEGKSDQFGEAPDEGESKFAGSPPIGDGGPFYDGGQDALDFMVSTPARPYRPRPSRTSGTSHAAKQSRRVAAGLNAAYNPMSAMLDATRLGITGHSYGAIGASYLAQYDGRLDAVVGWDALCFPRNARQSEVDALLTPHPGGPATLATIPLPNAAVSLSRDCFGAPSGYPNDVTPRSPALSLTGDYVLPSQYGDRPDREYKAAASSDYSRAGVDSGAIVIRGASHVDWAWYAGAPVATLRGLDIGTWYMAAWFDKYLKDDPTADARLLSDRWRHDVTTARVDPRHDPNALSELFRSRLDIRTDAGTRVACEDLRAGCPALRSETADCGPPTFGYVAIATAADTAAGLFRSACTAAARCRSRRVVTITLPRAIVRRGVRSIRVKVAARTWRAAPRGRTVRVDLRGLTASRGDRVRVRIAITPRRGRVTTLDRGYRVCVPRS
jgi:dienelactone hydrolase